MPAKSEAVLTTNCCDCGAEKHFSQYAVNRGRHLNPRCRLCGLRFAKANDPNKRTKEDKAEYLKAYYQKNKARLDEYSNQWREGKRLEFINIAGGKCVECGETDPIVLDFDHINNDGAEHRRSTKRTNVINILVKQGFDPYKMQLLCKNCNWRKEYNRRKDASKIKEAA